MEILTLVSGLVALLALAGTLAGNPALAGLGRGLVPLAPLGGVLYLLLDAAILLRRLGRSGFARGLGSIAGIAVLATTLFLLVGFVLGGPLAGFLRIHLLSKITVVTLLAGALSFGMAGPARFPPRWQRQLAAGLALAPAGTCAVVLLSYVAGAPLLYQSGNTPMALPSALAGLFMGLALLGLPGRDTWPLAFFCLASPGDPDRGRPGSTRAPMAAFLLLAVAMLVGGSFYLRGQLQSARMAAQDELSAIADLKTGQIAGWHRERLEDANQIVNSRLLQGHLKDFLAGSGTGPELEEWMEGLRRGGGYEQIVLFDAQGRIRIPARGVGPVDKARIQAALADGTVRVDDLDRDGSSIHLDVWAPVGLRPGGRPMGVLLLRLDPHPFLFPLVRSWPTASASAETLLVRREGGDVLYLNDIRHRAGAALSLRIPIAANPYLPSTQAILGRTGLMRGRDYRGVPVLAAVRGVPGTPWFMVAKIDEAEIFGPLRVRAWISGATLLGLITLLALGISLLLRQMETARVAENLDQERHRRILEGRFQSLLRLANDAVLTFDAESRITGANDRALEYYGWTPDEIQELRAVDLRTPEEAPSARIQFEALARTGTLRFETVHRRKDGSTFPVEVSSRSVEIEGERIAFSLIHDISDRRARERDLEKLTHLYAALSQVNQAIVWTRSRVELFAKICEVLVEFGHFRMAWIAGLDPGGITVLGQYGDREGFLGDFLVAWEASSRHSGPVGAALLEGRSSIANDYLSTAEEPWKEAARRSRFAAAAAFPIRLRGGVVGALAVYDDFEGCFTDKEVQLLEEAATDMSFALDHMAGEEQRERAEAELFESEQRFRMLFEKSPVGYFTLDAEGRILDVNETLLAMLACEREDLTGRWFGDIMTPVSAELARERHAALGATGRIGGTEFTLVRKDGTNLIVNFEGAAGHDAAGRFQHTRCVLTDLTERLAAETAHRELQAQLYQSQKMESLGSLAGGIAHDINNVLAAILSLASAHREGLDPGDVLAQSMDTISLACLRGRDVVKSLLYFARKGVATLGPVDLNQVVRDMIQLLTRTTLKRINLETDLQEPLPSIQAEAGTLSHVLMNICVNAKDAMPQGGTLRFRTRIREDGSLELAVRDTGEGMTDDVRKRAMEPFFTTKPTGQGTGLGLAMVFGTMKSLGGATEIHSGPGQGTEVVLSFPAPPGSAAPAAAAAETSATAQPRRALSILLVDDDELIRSSVVPMLDLLGHQARSVDSGIKALNLFEGGLEVDLVILDMNMPGLNGAETLHGLLLLRPDQPVIMASGYNDHDLSRLLEGRPRVVSIQKPFHLHEIQQRIAALGLADAAP